MTKTQAPRLRVSDPAELIDAVPYLLGFHPSESLVVIGLARARRRVQTPLREVRVTLRVDIPDGPVCAGDFDWLAGALRRAEVSGLICVWITERDEAGRAALLRDVHEVLAADALAADLVILDVLLASSTRWWSASVADLACHPPDGSPRRVGTSVAAAEATLAGLVALPERAAVQARLTGRPDHERLKLLPALTETLACVGGCRDAAREVAGLLAGAAACGSAERSEQFGAEQDRAGPASRPQLSRADLVAYAIALRDIEVRDAVWLLIDDGELEAEPLLEELHTRLPPPFDAAALFLFGWSRWRSGDGALAAMAAERAICSDEHYSAAHLLLATVRGGMDPHRTPRLRDSLRGRR